MAGESIAAGEAIATLERALVKKIATVEAISSVDPIIVLHTCLTGQPLPTVVQASALVPPCANRAMVLALQSQTVRGRILLVLESVWIGPTFQSLRSQISR